ncbi:MULTISPECIES: glycosyltransferase family 1 protein [Erysipelotrichaceae]|uniref:glycosyltransferase family 1 protein n=1 Tax=Erysipelotrichaceae TaxID=128827 RepID=UPI00272BCC3F|nr:MULTISPECIES: glycosyltransferase family 1 protein [Erysipelotrichaceae]
MIRVLEVFREPMANGGQESFLMNMYRNMDRTKVQLDFLTPFTCDNPDLKMEIESMGGQMFTYDHPFGENNNAVFKKSVQDFLANHPYSIVHFHSGSTYALMEGAKLAHDAGIPVRVVHSHCGGFKNLKYHVIKTLSIPWLLKYPTDYLACSDLAAEWKFPKSVIRNHRYTVIRNAVDTDRFRLDPKLREKIRTVLGVDANTPVLGHVGRFSLQKNHSFLIDIFAAVHRKSPEAILLLAGAGELEPEIRDKVKALDLENSVKFLGLRKDIPALMNAMDVFVLPSFFEGLPVVGVEAQATGLPVITSTAVARELPLKDLAQYIPLESSPEIWADAVLKAADESRLHRRNTTQEIAEAGYEIKAAARDFEQFYLDRAAEAGIRSDNSEAGQPSSASREKGTEA